MSGLGCTWPDLINVLLAIMTPLHAVCVCLCMVAERLLALCTFWQLAVRAPDWMSSPSRCCQLQYLHEKKERNMSFLGIGTDKGERRLYQQERRGK